MDQGVIDFTAHARATDPHTSHDAARSLDAKTLTEVQQNVLALLRVSPMHDEALITKYRLTYNAEVNGSTVRTRRAELVDSGLVVDSGRRAELASGRKSIVWRTA